MTSTIERHLVKQEILDTLYARARGADRFDATLMRACHPIDATDNRGSFKGLMHGMIDSLVKRTETGEIPPCQSKLHAIGNALFDFRDDEVFVESYHIAHETFEEPGGGKFYHTGGRYLDLFRQIDGRWLIQHRDIVFDWSRIMPTTVPFWNPATQPAALIGSRDDRDPTYLLGGVPRGQLPAKADSLKLQKGDLMDPVQQLLDKQDIAEVLYRSARASDRADAELAHSCYHPGATQRLGEFDGLAAEFIDRPKLESPIKGMLHMIANIHTDFTDDTHAFTESYHVAYVQMNDGIDASIGGRYLDKLEKRDGRWAIVHRDVIFDWSRMDPETSKSWDRNPTKTYLHGKRNEDDPLYVYVSRGR